MEIEGVSTTLEPLLPVSRQVAALGARAHGLGARRDPATGKRPISYLHQRPDKERGGDAAACVSDVANELQLTHWEVHGRPRRNILLDFLCS